MSRAFVTENAQVDGLPDRPISGHANLVTPSGLAAIEAALAAAQRAYGEAQARADREALARVGRELRYWSARRATAHVVSVSDNGTVKFGHSVTFLRDDGRKSTFRIVGEDEADAAKGSISYVSPLARALLGSRKGDVVHAGSGEVEIVDIQ